MCTWNQRLIILFLVLLNESVCKVLDTKRMLLSRSKRFFLWQEGVTWVTSQEFPELVIGAGFPVGLEVESATWGFQIQTGYGLNLNGTNLGNPGISNGRRRRSTSRWDIYEHITQIIDRSAIGVGKVCLLRAVCEASYNPFEQSSGLFAEIMHVLLMPSTTNEAINRHSDNEYHAAEKLGRNEEDCGTLFPECKFEILEQFTEIFF